MNNFNDLKPLFITHTFKNKNLKYIPLISPNIITLARDQFISNDHIKLFEDFRRSKDSTAFNKNVSKALSSDVLLSLIKRSKILTMLFVHFFKDIEGYNLNILLTISTRNRLMVDLLLDISQAIKSDFTKWSNNINYGITTSLLAGLIFNTFTGYISSNTHKIVENESIRLVKTFLTNLLKLFTVKTSKDYKGNMAIQQNIILIPQKCVPKELLDISDLVFYTLPSISPLKWGYKDHEVYHASNRIDNKILNYDSRLSDINIKYSKAFTDNINFLQLGSFIIHEKCSEFINKMCVFFTINTSKLKLSPTNHKIMVNFLEWYTSTPEHKGRYPSILDSLKQYVFLNWKSLYTPKNRYGSRQNALDINSYNKLMGELEPVIWEYLYITNVSSHIFNIPLHQNVFIDWRGRIYFSSNFNHIDRKSLRDLMLFKICDNSDPVKGKSVYIDYICKMFNTKEHGFKVITNIHNFNDYWDFLYNTDITKTSPDKNHNKIYITLFNLYNWDLFISDGYMPIISADATNSAIQITSILLKNTEYGISSNILPREDGIFGKLDTYNLILHRLRDKLKDCINDNYHINNLLNRNVIKSIIIPKVYGGSDKVIKSSIISNYRNEYGLSYDVDNKSSWDAVSLIVDSVNNDPLILEINKLRLKLSDICKSIYSHMFLVIKNKYLKIEFRNFLSDTKRLSIPIIIDDGLNPDMKDHDGLTKRNVTVTLHKIRSSKEKTPKNYMVNLIHSIDACIMQEVIKLCRSKGIQLYTVHDCFLITPDNYDSLISIYNTAVYNTLNNYNILDNFKDLKWEHSDSNIKYFQELNNKNFNYKSILNATHPIVYD